MSKAHTKRPEAFEQRLKDLVAAGWRYQGIAEALTLEFGEPITKNIVCGYVFRFGLGKPVAEDWRQKKGQA